MSLYDRRGYDQQSIGNGRYNSYEEVAQSGSLSAFVSQTYKLLAASLIAATAGAYIGLGFVPQIASFHWVVMIAFIASFFGVMFLKNKPGINLVMLFVFTFISGIYIVPLLAYVLKMPNGASAVASAFLMTAIIFGAMSIYAMKTDRDLAGMGKVLFIAVIVILIGSIINIFLGSSLLQVAISAIATLVFSLYIAYDTQMLLRGAFSSPVEAAISLYMDVFNIFVSLLQLFGILGSSDD